MHFGEMEVFAKKVKAGLDTKRHSLMTEQVEEMSREIKAIIYKGGKSLSGCHVSQD